MLNVLPALPLKHVDERASADVSGHMTAVLAHAAAGPRLRQLLLHRLFQLEKGRVAAGRRVVNRVAVGGNQWHAGVLGTAFGVKEGLCGAVAKVTIQQRVIQHFSSGPLFL